MFAVSAIETTEKGINKDRWWGTGDFGVKEQRGKET